VSDPKDINPFPETDTEAPRDMPPLTVMSLSVRTVVNHKENKREVVCATARIWSNSKSLSHVAVRFRALTSYATLPICILTIAPPLLFAPWGTLGTQSASTIRLPRNRFPVLSIHSYGRSIGSLRTSNQGPRQARKGSSHP